MSAGAARGAVVAIRAPAKLNLGLAVLGRRPDGYHELWTLFQAVSLCDRLEIARARRGIAVHCPALPGLGEANLAHRAAALFLRETGTAGGVRIALDKRIPAGGGLGGGSSDAAAVLVGLCRLFGRSPERGRLREWAATLGSDVPFFIDGGAAIGTGRGESLEAVPPWSGPAAVLIHLPPSGLSTAAVYSRVRAPALTAGTPAPTILSARWLEGDLERLGEALFNDLETPAFSLAPGLGAVKAALLDEGASGALLCGSGSSVFGLFTSPGAADRAGRRLRGRFAGRLVRAHFVRERRRWGVVKR